LPCCVHALRDEAVSRDFAGSLVTEEDHLERVSGACGSLGWICEGVRRVAWAMRLPSIIAVHFEIQTPLLAKK
jgi:hypothetical protein